jgi:hypothetical protein
MKNTLKLVIMLFCFYSFYSFTEDCNNSPNPCACRWNQGANDALSEYAGNTYSCLRKWAPEVCMKEADAIFNDQISIAWDAYMNC